MRLLVRCDADAETGLGHASRALAVAEVIAARRMTRPIFVSRPDPLLQRFLAGRPVEIAPLAEDGYAAAAVLERAAGETAYLVSDTYELDEAALDAVAGAGVRHLVVDDFARLESWRCDAIVNPNIGADASAYRTDAVVGAGPSYALLRSEVRELAARPRRVRPQADRVLVCLGGGAWPAAADELLRALVSLDVEVRATRAEGSVPEGVLAVPPSTLVDQMAWADVGVFSGGVVKYEGAAAGLPMLLVATVAHQEAVAEAFAAEGGAEYFGPLGAVDGAAVAARVQALLGEERARTALMRRARALVDGRGAERAADLLLDAAGR